MATITRARLQWFDHDVLVACVAKGLQLATRYTSAGPLALVGDAIMMRLSAGSAAADAKASCRAEDDGHDVMRMQWPDTLCDATWGDSVLDKDGSDLF